MIIVNKDNQIEKITRSEVADLFLKTTKHWPNGTTVRFIDRQAGSEERKKFFKSFLHKSNGEIDMYWIGQKLYTGASAPLQVNSDQMMVSVVSAFSGAIGYVSEGFPISGKIKKIDIAP